VRIAGTEPTLAIARRIDALGLAYRTYLNRYIHPLAGAGHRLENQFDGFRRMLNDPTNTMVMSNTVNTLLARPTGELDSHPSADERGAHVRSLPYVPAAGHRYPARELLVGADDVEAAVTAAYCSVIAPAAEPTVIEWESCGPVLAAQYSSHVEALLSVTGTSSAPTAIRAALRSLVTERSRFVLRFSRALGVRPDSVFSMRESMAAAIGQALVDQGTHVWSSSWTAPFAVEPTLRAPDVDVWALAEAAVDDGNGAAVFRALGSLMPRETMLSLAC
jgi:hypothetical protein